MNQAVLRACPSCGTFTLRTACPACETPTREPGPSKFSPEDKYGSYRRRLKRLDEAEGKDDETT